MIATVTRDDEPSRIVIAIDGPSGAGKGTVARAVARALNLRHVDTGAMYRAVAWKALRTGVPLTAEDQVARVAAEASFTLESGRVLIDEHDVTERIRTPEIDAGATAVARLPQVRRILVERQRRLGQGGGVVMEGRDIGTAVFPDADLKIYLDASPEERARRRAHDPAHAGAGRREIAEVADALAVRDRSDRTRANSPLMVAADASRIDTTNLSIDEVVARVLEIIERKIY
jgi:cytidylate kinase